jgi:hypothetical protein
VEVNHEKWGWVYASIAGTGEMLFEVPETVRDDLFSGKFPQNFPFRNVTTVKIRNETPEETRTRLKSNGAGPKTADLVIETFKWLLVQEGAVLGNGRMAGAAISWVVPPTDAIAQAASRTWSGSKILIAEMAHLTSLDGGKFGRS